jgi:hypothetical protein
MYSALQSIMSHIQKILPIVYQWEQKSGATDRRIEALERYQQSKTLDERRNDNHTQNNSALNESIERLKAEKSILEQQILALKENSSMKEVDEGSGKRKRA